MGLEELLETKKNRPVHKDGGPEEEYFFRQNQELIRKKRAELDAERVRRQAEAQKQLHWLRCPKCGTEMNETKLSEVQVEQCPACHGVYLDQGELDLLLQSNKIFAFLRRLRRG